MLADLGMRSMVAVAALVAGLVCPGWSAQGAPSTEKIGLAVGQKAPGFSLKDHNDRTVSLDALLKKGPVALVFYRSADW
jgi:AhpC/TSA family